MNQEDIKKLIQLRDEGETWKSLAKKFKGQTPNALRKTYYRNIRRPHMKVLIFDIETAPILAHVWDIWDQNVALNQIKQDWYVLSWSAKWLYDDPKNVMYADQRNAKNIENDKGILKKLWKLLDEADVVITQNGVKFDVPKINARFIQHGFPPPSSFRHIDTLKIARATFGFTSNKLEYMTDKLCKKYKKLKHSKFSGFEMWKQCLAGNLEAWKEMEEYNKYDVLSLEELYTIVAPWNSKINFNIYHDTNVHQCNACGSLEFKQKGFKYTNSAKYHRYICVNCGCEAVSKVNVLSSKKKESILK